MTWHHHQLTTSLIGVFLSFSTYFEFIQILWVDNSRSSIMLCNHFSYSFNQSVNSTTHRYRIDRKCVKSVLIDPHISFVIVAHTQTRLRTFIMWHKQAEIWPNFELLIIIISRSTNWDEKRELHAEKGIKIWNLSLIVKLESTSHV